MKLSDYKHAYEEFSGKSSDVARQLAFAGIALVWIFKIDHSGNYALPSTLHLPLALLIFTLCSDLFQYIMASAIWGIYHRVQEKKRPDVNDDPDIEAPYYFHYPITLFFILKLMSVCLAYAFLFFHLFDSFVWE